MEYTYSPELRAFDWLCTSATFGEVQGHPCLRYVWSLTVDLSEARGDSFQDLFPALDEFVVELLQSHEADSLIFMRRA